MHEEDPDLLAGEALDRLRGRNTADEIKQLRKERDEARREVCQMVSNNDESSKPESAEQVAERRKWDCFKENTDE